ncbi:MAG: hypothetical protein DIZ78_09845 [endosymbiont of Escarpia spicata]|uniref:Glycosyltransferase 2-like domain-containing protein n=1 Tax=endosymbiont of Escarpia spicata TaxID=2200908 RepID=A0A370DP04_9GAMM|nr:MAG: hypothetical protein DIZ78_09845 [endosymbiont of Escarpia spicata]
MATFPGRVETLDLVVKNLSKQLDALYIYLNEFEETPEFLTQYENVYPILGKDTFGDLVANGKMIFLDYEKDDYIAFTLDDDIVFPDDYVEHMSALLESMNYRVGLTVHGSIIPDTASWYYERTHVFGAKKSLNYHTAVNLVGSGTFVYHSKSIPLDFDDFTREVYVDLHLSLAAFNNGIPLMAIKRETNWLKFIKYTGLWEQFKVGVTHHTRIMQDSDLWRLSNIQNVWKDFLAAGGDDWFTYSTNNELDLDFCASIYSKSIPLNWRGSRVSMQKALIFSQEFE